MLAMLFACADALHAPDWDGGVFLEITGPVLAEVDPDSEPTAVVVWTWVVDDHVGAEVSPVAFEPVLQGYVARVTHPPHLAPGEVLAPAELQLLGNTSLLLGALVLLDGPVEGASVEPVPTLEALIAGRIPTEFLTGPVVVAGWTDHRLVAVGGADVPRLDALPGWSGEPCEIAGVGGGLAMWSVADGCAWTRRLPAGEPGMVDQVPLNGVPR